jgi:hypothetical protein
MSRKRRPPISRNRKATRCQVGRIEKSSVRERTVPRDGAEFTEFFRSRDPQIMGPLMLALNKSRTLFSWLTPGSRVSVYRSGAVRICRGSLSSMISTLPR